MITDSHCHLASKQFKDDLNEIVESANRSQVSRLITIGTDLDDSKCCIKIANSFNSVYATVGIHPCSVTEIIQDDWLQELKNLSGLNKEVKKYITCDPFYSTFINNLKYFIKPLIPKYEQEGKNYLTISIGCTGGQHRSVCVIEEIGNWLDLKGIKFDINHRDLIMDMNKYKVSS